MTENGAMKGDERVNEMLRMVDSFANEIDIGGAIGLGIVLVDPEGQYRVGYAGNLPLINTGLDLLKQGILSELMEGKTEGDYGFEFEEDDEGPTEVQG